MIKVKIHSSVDVITNSSTVIYTYQNSTKQVKELVAEIIKLSGKENLTPDDVFYYGEFCDDEYLYTENDECPEDMDTDTLRALMVSIMKGEVEKPDWMISAENNESWNGFLPDISLNILAKSDDYKDLASKLISFLNSPTHEAGRDG